MLDKFFQKSFFDNNLSKARKMGVKVGENCRFYSAHFGSEPYLITIGNHVTITDGVRFITHDGGIWVFREEEPQADVFGEISIGDNVFIGVGSIILPGVTIGNNTVIGAGSVVSRSFSGNGVIAGNPARLICTLEEYREKLSRVKLNTKGMSDEGIIREIAHNPDKLLRKKQIKGYCVQTELSIFNSEKDVD